MHIQTLLTDTETGSVLKPIHKEPSSATTDTSEVLWTFRTSTTVQLYIIPRCGKRWEDVLPHHTSHIMSLHPNMKWIALDSHGGHRCVSRESTSVPTGASEDYIISMEAHFSLIRNNVFITSQQGQESLMSFLRATGVPGCSYSNDYEFLLTCVGFGSPLGRMMTFKFGSQRDNK
jgi:hypothetical protein